MQDQILLKSGVTITRLSKELESPNTGSQAITLGVADRLYIGSSLPFSGRYFKQSAGGLSGATLSARYWDGNGFREAVDTWDQTDGFSNSGYVFWTPNKGYDWAREDTQNTDGSARIPELSTIAIYDLYWVELRSDQEITVTLEWVKHLFSQQDTDLDAEYSELRRANTLAALGINDYENTRFRASELVEQYLQGKEDIINSNQIINPLELKLACVSKVAEISYGLLGDDFSDQAELARSNFEKRSRPNIFKKDANVNGRIDRKEVRVRTSEFTR